MKDVVLSYGKDGQWRYQSSSDESPIVVCSIREACQRLHKSRRQIYRYIQSRQLMTVANIFGTLLVDLSEVENLQKFPLSVQPLPAMLRPLFPEYELSKLNAGRYRNLIICRVLESGSLKQVKWLMRRYPKKNIVKALRSDGLRLLSDRSFSFWILYYNVHVSQIWRQNVKGPWKH